MKAWAFMKKKTGTIPRNPDGRLSIFPSKEGLVADEEYRVTKVLIIPESAARLTEEEKRALGYWAHTNPKEWGSPNVPMREATHTGVRKLLAALGMEE